MYKSLDKRWVGGQSTQIFENARVDRGCIDDCECRAFVALWNQCRLQLTPPHRDARCRSID